MSEVSASPCSYNASIPADRHRGLNTCGSLSLSDNTHRQHFRCSASLRSDSPRRCRGACRAGGGQLSSACGGPTSVFVLKMAEAAAVPPHRFFCHCCKGEVNPKLPVRLDVLSVFYPSHSLVQFARLTSQHLSERTKQKPAFVSPLLASQASTLASLLAVSGVCCCCCCCC